MDPGFLQVFEQAREMLFDQWRIIHRAITQRPGSSLHYAVFVVKKKIKLFVESSLVFPDPMNDLVCLGFGMFFKNSFAKFHTGKVMGSGRIYSSQAAVFPIIYIMLSIIIETSRAAINKAALVKDGP
jgi:hypothetical protein